MKPGAPSTRIGLRVALQTDTGRLVLVSAIAVGIPLLAAYVTGAVDHPHNDDWAFYRILFDLSDTGHFHLVGWNEMTLIGHLAAALPLVKVFGHNVTAVNTFEAILSGAGLVALGMIARRFLPSRYALLVVVMVAVFPAFAIMVPTFMTDNAAIAAQMACVALGLAGISAEGKKRHYLVTASLVVGLFGFSIREFALVAPLAVVIGYGLAQKKSRRSLIGPLVSLFALAGIAVAVYAWRHAIPGDSSHSGQQPSFTSMLVAASQGLFGLSLAVAPALLIALRNRVQLGSQIAVATIGTMMLGLFAIQKTAFTPTCCFNSQGSVFLGNMLTERGALGNQVLFGDRPVLFPAPLWIFLSAAAVAAAAALVVLGVKRLLQFQPRALLDDPSSATLVALGLGTVAAIVVRARLGGAVLDRYLTVLIAVVGIFLLRGRPVARSVKEGAGPLAALAGLTLVAFMVVMNRSAFDAARWRGGEAAVAAGIPARDVDAGFEWVGYRYPGVVREAAARRSAATPPGYMDLFPRAGNCGVVAASPASGPEFVPIAEIPYREFLTVQHVYVYRYLPGCEAAGLPAG
jgi:hypothetical protein